MMTLRTILAVVAVLTVAAVGNTNDRVTLIRDLALLTFAALMVLA